MHGFCEVAGTLGDKLGALLFQLPPNLKKDLAAVRRVPRRAAAEGRARAFEFRHASWLDDEVFERLAARNLALCVADSEKMSTPVRITADYAYFRLRDEGYTPDDIERWAETIARDTAACRDVFVYFKHEEEGKGPSSRTSSSRRSARANGVKSARVDSQRQRTLGLGRGRWRWSWSRRGSGFRWPDTRCDPVVGRSPARPHDSGVRPGLMPTGFSRGQCDRVGLISRRSPRHDQLQRPARLATLAIRASRCAVGYVCAGTC